MELLLATIIQLTIQEDLTMKPFLGIDLTNNSENEHQNGIEFLIQETPAEVISIVQKQSTRIENMEQKSQPSSLLQFIQYGSIVFFLLTITTALKLDTPFSAKYHNAPWLYGALQSVESLDLFSPFQTDEKENAFCIQVNR